MADGPYGANPIYIDLTVAGARTIKDAVRPIGDLNFTPDVGKIKSVRIQGTAGAGAGDIVLRKDSAAGGIVFKTAVAAGVPQDGVDTPMDREFRGLYMDAIPAAWVAGSFMLIELE